MASRRTYILLGAAAGSYFVGFILCIVGYSIPWMQPKATYDSAVLSVGLVTSCFKNFKFPQYIDRERTLFDGCSRVYEPRFDRLQDYVNPVWFARVRQMHFACILILSLNILLIIGYVATYIVAVRQTRKRGTRPTSAIVLTKAACSSWFVFVGVVAILQIVEPSVFHYNYDRNSATFYTVPQGGAPLYYSGGFAVTIVAAFFCIASTVSGGLLFVGVCRKASRVLGENYIERKMGGGDLGSAASLAYNRREGERRAEADGADLIEKLTAHSQQQSPAFVDAVSRASSAAQGDYRSGEPPRASYTPSSRYAAATADDQRGGGDRASLVSSPTGSQQQQRPVPAPRRSLSSRSQEALNRPPSEEPVQRPAWTPSSEAAAAARSSAHELRHGSDHSATKSGRERAAMEVASEYGGGSSRRRYSAGSSYRPQQPATAPAVARPPSISSGGGGASGPRQQPEDSRSGASSRRPGDLSLGQGSLPRSSASGGCGGESHPTSLASTDISVAASVHYESNPASGYKPKELAMLRFISDRSQAANAAAVARASMERSRSSGGGSSRGSERGQQPRQSTGASGPTSPAGLKSPVGSKSPSSAATEGGPQPPALSSTPSTKKNSIYVSY